MDLPGIEVYDECDDDVTTESTESSSDGSTVTSSSSTETVNSELLSNSDYNKFLSGDESTIEASSSKDMMDEEFNVNLVNRLENEIICVICEIMPRYRPIYQCPQSHLICAPCFQDRFLDDSVHDAHTICPKCNHSLYRQTVGRNLVLEQVIAELPVMCQFCRVEYTQETITQHKNFECPKRLVRCKFKRVGCQWQNAFCKLAEHERTCDMLTKTGSELEAFTEHFDQQLKRIQLTRKSFVDLLSSERLSIVELQMKRKAKPEYIEGDFYETPDFNAFGETWTVRFIIEKRACNLKTSNDLHKDIERTAFYSYRYQLVLKTDAELPLQIHMSAVRGPYSELDYFQQVNYFVFTNTNKESLHFRLLETNYEKCINILSTGLFIRLFMFMEKV